MREEERERALLEIIQRITLERIGYDQWIGFDELLRIWASFGHCIAVFD